MARAQTIYISKDNVVFSYLHAKEFVQYATTIKILDAGKNPVSISLKFDDTPTFIAPMPPEKHTISAPTIVELFRKLERWLRKYGYTFYT